jgi:putative ATP-dependent endonuclease of OLD family
MAIKTLRIEHYRSISDVEITLGQLNVLVGRNNTGKSNIIQALNVVLGETWPRPFTEKDFHKHDGRKPIVITVMFDGPLESEPEVYGFRLTSRNASDDLEFYAINQDGEDIVYGRGYNKRVNRSMREEVALLYLGIDRQAEKQLRPTQWTLYGKLLKRIEAKIKEADRERFRETVDAAYKEHIAPVVDPVQATINDFVQRQTGLSVEMVFQLLNPLEVLKGVRPYIIEDGMTFDPEEVGAGVQSALALGIAKAYAEVVRKPLVLAIEEPELNLHPHACRHFNSLLRELSGEGLQIIYTTHERSFIDVGSYENIHLVRKGKGETHVRSGSDLDDIEDKDRLKLLSKFNERLNEVFFSSVVVLCEGPADEIATRCALERLGIELDRLNISVLGMDSISDIATPARLLKDFKIRTVALVDEDPGNKVSAKTRQKIIDILGEDRVFIQSPNIEGLFGLEEKPKRVDALAFFPEWFESHPKKDVPQVYQDIKAYIDSVFAPKP